jgi:hypothetical protein
MNKPLIVAILLICARPAYAQGQRPSVANLKADAQKVASIIKGDKAKTQTYCQINDLGGQINEANEDQDNKKARHYFSRSPNWRKNLVPNILPW